MAQVDFLPHPITTQGRETLTVSIQQGDTLEKVLSGVVPPRLSAVAVIDGTVVSRPAWATTRITRNSVIQVRSVMQRGDGSNPFAIILTIAVLVAAPYLAGVILPAAASATLVSGAAAIIGFGGVLAVNALFPPRFPDDGSSPTQKRQYSLSGGANRARPHEPFLLLLGQHRVFPDLAAREYTQFIQEQSQDTRTPVAATGGEAPPSIWGDIPFETPIGGTQQTSSYTAAQVKVWNTQILYQLFDFGIGNLLISNRRIQETLLAEFSDVETQAQENITLVDGTVDTIRGGDFMPNVPITRRTEAKTVKIVPQIISQNFELNEQGNIVGGSNAFTVEYRRVGDANWTLRNVTMYSPSSADARTPSRQTFYYTVPEGQYDVRITLTTVWDEANDRLSASATLFSINAHQAQTANFSGRNPLAVKIRATGQIYGPIGSLNADAKQLIPAWDGNAWLDAQETSNPSWVMRKFWQGWRRPSDNRLMAGRGLADDRIDDESLKGWGAFCTLHGLTCNLVIDSRMSDEELEALIFQCGWGFLDKTSGKRGVKWENSNEPVTAVFNPSNIVAGSMSISYENEGLADEIIGTFVDSESDYEDNTLRRTVPGTGTPERPVTVPMKGITNGTQGAKELNRMAAGQVYHPRTLTWEVVEGPPYVSKGAVVGLGHDLAGGTVGGRITRINAARNQIEVTAEVPIAGTMWIWDLNGDVFSYAYTRVGGLISLTNSAIPVPPSGLTDDPLAYRYTAFDPAADPVKVRITAVEHVVGGVFRLTARNESEQYYDARTSDLTHELLPARERYRPVESQVLSIARGLGGRDGSGYEFIYRRTTTEVPPPVPDTTAAQRNENKFVPPLWTDNPLGTSELLPYEWWCYRQGTTQNWSPFLPELEPVLWGKYTEPFDPGGEPNAPLVGALSQGGSDGDWLFLVGVDFVDDVHVRAVTKAQVQVTKASDPLFAAPVHDVELSRPPVHWTVPGITDAGKYLFRARLWNWKADSKAGVWSDWSVAISRVTEPGQRDSGLPGAVQDFYVEDNEEAAGNTARVYLREPETNSKSIWGYEIQAKKAPLWSINVEDTIGVKGVQVTGAAGSVGAGGHLLTDASQAWTVDEWVGKILYLYDSLDTATGEVGMPHAYPIRGNTATVIDIGAGGSYSFPADVTGEQKYLIVDRWQKTPDDMVILASENVYDALSLPGHSPDKERWQWSYQVSSPAYWRARPKNQPGFGPWNYYDGIEP